MLDYKITCRNYELAPKDKSYITKKLNKHTKLIPPNSKIFIDISTSKDSKVKLIEFKTQLKGPKLSINTKLEGEELLALIDKTDLIIKRKLLQIQKKDIEHTQNLEKIPPEVQTVEEETEEYIAPFTPTYKITKKIYSDDRPMHVDEVIEMMETKGFNSYLFKNFENSKYCMLKKNSKGEYELIEPPV